MRIKPKFVDNDDTTTTLIEEDDMKISHKKQQKAVLIGCNKYPNAPLYGCVNDIMAVLSLLLGLGWKRESIKVLIDEQATAKAIMDAYKWLYTGNAEGDKLLEWRSMHGAQVPSAVEKDHYAEVICPIDFDWNKPSTWIRDITLRSLIADQPVGVQCYIFADNCFSGGDITRAFKKPWLFNRKPINPRRMRADKATKAILDARIAKVAPIEKIKAKVQFWAACQESQTAADANFNNQPNGAFTYFFLQNFTNGIIADDLQKGIASGLEDNGFDQVPVVLYFNETPNDKVIFTL